MPARSLPPRSSTWRHRWQWGALGLAMVSLGALAAPLLAVQLGDGRTAFNRPPRLDSFVTTRSRTGDHRATYYATITLLPETGEALQALQVSLIEGRFRLLAYRLDDIEVFLGDRARRGPPVPLAAVTYDDDAQTLQVTLAEAVMPGQTLTLALKPVRNPTQAGVYLFELLAAPAGEAPVWQRIGIGRIHLYRPDGRDPFSFP